MTTITLPAGSTGYDRKGKPFTRLGAHTMTIQDEHADENYTPEERTLGIYRIIRFRQERTAAHYSQWRHAPGSAAAL